MTPEELAEEIAEAPVRAMEMMTQAKSTTHLSQKPIPPILHSMRQDGSTLQITGPHGYDLDQEFETAVRMLRLAQTWSADHTVIALDTRRIFDPSHAPDADQRTPENLFETTADAEVSAEAILVHTFDATNGNGAQAICFTIDDDCRVEFAAEPLVVDDAWLQWAQIPHTMSECLTPRADFIGGRSFQDEAEAADSDKYGIFVIENVPGFVLVRVWGNNYREESIPAELPRDEIHSHIERVFAASRLVSVSGGLS